VDRLGGYGSSEQQSICRVAHFAVSKRIDKAKRLQYTLWTFCNQMQRSIQTLIFFVTFFSSKETFPERESLNAYKREIT